MSDHQDLEGEVRFFLFVKHEHSAERDEIVRYLMNKTNVSKAAARHAVNEMVRDKKLHQKEGLLSLPD